MKRFIVKGITIAVMVTALAFPPAMSVFAASPGTQGQPDQSCQSFFGDSGPFTPNGFNTAGFAHAESVYAGSDGTPSQANGSPNAVAQYDVACFQASQHQP